MLLYEQFEMDQYLRELQSENNAFKKLIHDRDQFIQFNKWKESYDLNECWIVDNLPLLRIPT